MLWRRSYPAYSRRSTGYDRRFQEVCPPSPPPHHHHHPLPSFPPVLLPLCIPPPHVRKNHDQKHQHRRKALPLLLPLHHHHHPHHLHLHRSCDDHPGKAPTMNRLLKIHPRSPTTLHPPHRLDNVCDYCWL